MMLADALKDLNRFELKYKHLSELAAIWTAKEQVVETQKRRRGRRPKADDRPGGKPMPSEAGRAKRVEPSRL